HQPDDQLSSDILAPPLHDALPILLAPSTAPDGAVRMARRLTQALETASPRPAGLPPLLVRAGYEAVADLHATPLAPDRLLEHAGAALIQARTAGNGERIRAYQD